MKFICPSCKAKYQIADDKVSGRSVKMKCRKCGHLIDIGASEILQETVAHRPSTASAPAAIRRTAPTSALASRPRASALPQASRSSSKAPQTAAKVAVLEPNAPVPRPSRAVPFSAFALEEPTRISSAGALAGAFTQSFNQSSAAVQAKEARVPEWFVGINGVPVGPMHLDEISTKAASGTIDPDSLVWRDGMEEWQPLSSFPELLRLVEERVSQPLPVDPSALSPAGNGAASPSAPRASEPDPPAKAEPQPEAAGALSDPAAFGSVGAETRVPESRASLSETGPAVVADGLDLHLAALHRRAGSSKAAWLAVAIALLFGLTIGFVLFSRQETREIVRYVEKPAAQPSAQAERQPDRDEPSGDEESSGEAPTEPGSATRVAQRRSGKDQTAPAAGNHTGLSGLKGLKELQGSGPSGGPSSAATPANGAGAKPLDSAKVQATVARYTGSVKRSCWQPALHARDKDAPASARVTVTISVEPSGRVSRVQTSGDPNGYRGLAGCIASRVRSWRFPSSSEPTTANVPFIFAAQ